MESTSVGSAGEEGAAVSTSITAVDAWTGVSVASVAVPGRALRVVPLPLEDEHGRKAALVFVTSPSQAGAAADSGSESEAGSVAYLVPSTPQTRTQLAAMADTLVVHGERKAPQGTNGPDYVDGMALQPAALRNLVASAAVGGAEPGLAEDELEACGPVPVERIWSLSSRMRGALASADDFAAPVP